MTAMTQTTQDVRGLVNAQRERSRAQIARYHEIRDALETIRISTTSTDRSVTVDMAAGGAIVDLHLTPQAMGKTPDTLAATILEAIRLGLAEVAHRTAAEVEPLTGRRIDVAAISQGRLPALEDSAGGNADAGEQGDDRARPGPRPEASPAADAAPAAPPASSAATPADPRFATEEE